MSLKIDEPPGTNRDIVRDMLRQICPKAVLNVAEDGTVNLLDPNFCIAALAGMIAMQHRSCCKCICDIVGSERTVTIRVNDDLKLHGGGRTIAADNDDSANGIGSDQTVEIENKSRYRQKRTDTLEWMDVPGWVILAHELCGHALPGINGTEPEWRPGKPGYRKDWHHASEQIETDIRTEHRLPNRGTNHRVKQ